MARGAFFGHPIHCEQGKELLEQTKQWNHGSKATATNYLNLFCLKFGHQIHY